MSEITEQRVCIKFSMILGKNIMVTYAKIKITLEDDILSRFLTFKRFRHFKDCQKSSIDDPRSGRPSSSRKDDFEIYEKVRNK